MSEICYLFNPHLPLVLVDVPNALPGFTLPSLRLTPIHDFRYRVDDLYNASGYKYVTQSAREKCDEIVTLYGWRGIRVVEPLTGFGEKDVAQVEKAIFPSRPKNLPEAEKMISAAESRLKLLSDDRLMKASVQSLSVLKDAIDVAYRALEATRAEIMADYESKHRNTPMWGGEGILYDFAGLKRPSRAERIDETPLEERISAAIVKALSEAGVLKGGKSA